MQSYVLCDGRPVTQKQMTTQHERLKSMVFEWFCKEAAMPVDGLMITTNANCSRTHLKIENFQCCQGSFTVSKTVGVRGITVYSRI
jgi:hypothetical protein